MNTSETHIGEESCFRAAEVLDMNWIQHP
uniref:Uncharacterized protein n=1 Tax=Lepeophtheirus salmonis TaxID=72036 RepID=A0A0K2V705_LEPSM